MKSKFNDYIQKNVIRGNYRNLFYHWNFDEIFKKSKEWKLPEKYIYIYIIANNCSFRTAHSWVGCNSDITHRLCQLNGKEKGSPTETRNAAGHWKIMMKIEVPPFRNYSAKNIKKKCKRGKGKKKGHDMTCIVLIDPSK